MWRFCVSRKRCARWRRRWVGWAELNIIVFWNFLILFRLSFQISDYFYQLNHFIFIFFLCSNRAWSYPPRAHSYSGQWKTSSRRRAPHVSVCVCVYVWVCVLEQFYEHTFVFEISSEFIFSEFELNSLFSALSAPAHESVPLDHQDSLCDVTGWAEQTRDDVSSPMGRSAVHHTVKSAGGSCLTLYFIFFLLIIWIFHLFLCFLSVNFPNITHSLWHYLSLSLPLLSFQMARYCSYLLCALSIDDVTRSHMDLDVASKVLELLTVISHRLSCDDGSRCEIYFMLVKYYF